MGNQLHMVWPEHLRGRLPEVEVPPEYEIRVLGPEDETAQVALMHDAGFVGWSRRQLQEWKHRVLPDGIFVAVHNPSGELAATAMAAHRPTELHPEGGELGWVAGHPQHAGKRLGKAVSMAVVARFVSAGYREIYLLTDDHRLAAIKIYLELGFVPFICAPDMIHRWRAVCNRLECPADPAAWECAPRELWIEELPGEVRPDADHMDRYVPRHKWLPDRKHRGYACSGDVDAFGDESLYRPSQVGSATADPAAVEAGQTAGLTLVFVAGADGVPEGSTVTFVLRGNNPLGWKRAPEFEVSGPCHCRLEPLSRGPGFLLPRGALREGDRVVLRAEPFDWTPLAGRLEFRVVINTRDGRPEHRLPEPVTIDVRPDDVARLEATLPCTHRPGEAVEVSVTTRDRYDNRVREAATIRLEADGDAQEVPLARGRATGSLLTNGEAVLTVRARAAQADMACRSNPSVAVTDRHLYVGDLHCHDFLSEAAGYPDEVYRWAIEDRRLDFVSVVPQSHGWQDNETWTVVKYMNERFLTEGRFVPFLGFEWQHTGYGDKVVHYLGGDQPYLPRDDKRYASPAGLYQSLRGSDALVVSHHCAYPPGSWCASTDYDAIETDVERLVELWSMHGSSEGYDPTDRPLTKRAPERMILPALKRGLRVGFTAGSDTHSGRPGGSVKEPRPYWGGLTAVWADRLTRRDLFAALLARRTYALTGARIVLRMTVNDAPMGAELPHSDRAAIVVEAWAPDTIVKVEVVKNGELLRGFEPGRDECRIELDDAPGGAAFYYCRVALQDGHLAVCSPVWIG